MTGAAAERPEPPAVHAGGGPASPWRHRFAVLTVAATLLLIFAGGLVTSHGAGLSVPDWPLSYGMLMPPMVGNVFYEHGHRMVATFVGLLSLVLAAWTARAEARRGVRLLAWAALGAVVLQGVLGGLTVLYLLPAPVSVAHACLAQVFLCLVVAVAYATSAERRATLATRPEDASGVRHAARASAAIVFVQLVLGATMRHTGAGLAIPDFPTALGHWWPPLTDPGVALHFAHRLGAVAVLGAALWTWLACRGAARPLRRHAALVVVLALGQGALGAITVLSGKAPLVTSLHVVGGATVLAATWLLALRAAARLSPRTVPAQVPAVAEATTR